MTETEFKLEVVQRLARIETKIEALRNHEGRLRSLEKSRWMIGGGIALVVFGVPVALHFIK